MNYTVLFIFFMLTYNSCITTTAPHTIMYDDTGINYDSFSLSSAMFVKPWVEIKKKIIFKDNTSMNLDSKVLLLNSKSLDMKLDFLKINSEVFDLRNNKNYIYTFKSNLTYTLKFILENRTKIKEAQLKIEISKDTIFLKSNQFQIYDTIKP